MERSYICPHCGTKTAFSILPLVRADVKVFEEQTDNGETKFKVSDAIRCSFTVQKLRTEKDRFVSVCLNCEKFIYWEDGRIAYPMAKGIEPVKDMPEDAKEFFTEAQSIISLSPRAACALLRVCLELLVDHAGKNLPGFYKKMPLIEKINLLGVRPDVLDMLHACRAICNEFCHPGEINLKNEDTPEIAKDLSVLLNYLVDIWITPANLADRLKEIIKRR